MSMYTTNMIQLSYLPRSLFIGIYLTKKILITKFVLLPLKTLWLSIFEQNILHFRSSSYQTVVIMCTTTEFGMPIWYRSPLFTVTEMHPQFFVLLSHLQQEFSKYLEKSRMYHFMHTIFVSAVTNFKPGASLMSFNMKKD